MIKKKRGRPKGSKNHQQVKVLKRKVKPYPIEKVYKLINNVQINRKETEFVLDIKDLPIIQNIMKDLGLKHSESVNGLIANVIVYPNEEEVITKPRELDDDFFEDHFG